MLRPPRSLHPTDPIRLDSILFARRVPLFSSPPHSQLKSLKVSPDPPQPGETLTVTVEADVLKKIEVRSASAAGPTLVLTRRRVFALPREQDGAAADVTVKLGLIKLLQKSFDVCEEA